MPKPTVTIKSTRPLREVSSTALRTLAGEIGVLQLEQVARAFRTGGQPSRKWKPLSKGRSDRVRDGKYQKGHRGVSYRRGGKPLIDNGLLRASFFMMAPQITKNGVSVSIRSSSYYAPYHQHGWRADPARMYFIPLTLKARRTHRTGADPADEGLISGEDYIIVRGGWEVPARPMIDYDDPANKKEVIDTVASVFGTLT
mgnify:CR=1 FL=1